METIAELNKLYVDKLLPNIVWMGACLMIGVVGNSLVLLVYGTRMRSEVSDRYFIPILAFLDLVSSAISSLHGMFNYLFFANYPSATLCKFFNFGSFYTSALSAQTLLLIAIQRYRKVCVPFGRQMTLFWKRLAIVISSIVALGYSIPVIFTAGIVHWRRGNVTASQCAIDSDDNWLFYKIYYTSVFVILVTNVVAVTVLYTKIGCSIYRRGRNQKKNERKSGQSCHRRQERADHREDLDKVADSDIQQTTDSSYVSQDHCTHAQPEGLSLKGAKNVQNVPHEMSDGKYSARDEELIEADDTSKIPKSSGADYTKSQLKSKERKTTKWDRIKVNFNKMFGAIVIFYFISYVPTFILFVGTAFGALKDLDLNVFVFINRMYIVNHIVNPFVYGYFDFCFRHSLKSLFKCGR